MCFKLDNLVTFTNLSITRTQQAILSNLAKRTNSKTGACFPSIKTIAKDTRSSERTVYRALNALVKLGVLVRSKGRRGSNRYALVAQKLEMDIVRNYTQKSTNDGDFAPAMVSPETCHGVTLIEKLINNNTNNITSTNTSREVPPTSPVVVSLVNEGIRADKAKLLADNYTPERVKEVLGHRPPNSGPGWIVSALCHQYSFQERKRSESKISQDTNPYLTPEETQARLVGYEVTKKASMGLKEFMRAANMSIPTSVITNRRKE